jgi:hypothetical protein
MSRNIKDAELIKSVAIAAAGADSYTASVDLGAAGIASLEAIEVQLDIPVLPALVDDKTVILSLEDSADNSSFAAIESVTLTATGTETPGSAAAVTAKAKLPSNTRRYIRMKSATLAAAGNNTGVSVTMSVCT